jgi:uncharacterized protein (TIGR00661 family)
MLCCAEIGLGHVSRIIPLAKRLQQHGHELHFYSGGKAYELLKKEFPKVSMVQPIGWYENNHGINMPASLINIIFPLPFISEQGKIEVKTSNMYETMHRYYDLRKDILQLKPDLLVSDGDVNALRLSGRWHIPSVYIENMIRPSYGFSSLLSPGERFIERYYRIPKKVIIPDNPPPFTVSEYSIGDLASLGIDDHTEYVGSFIDTTPESGNQRHVFAPISGPVGTRSQLLSAILPAFKKAADPWVISLGTPGAKAPKQVGNKQIRTWLTTEERHRAMLDAKYVIFSGGHATCFETLKYGKPSICLPTQPEQLGNAAKLEKMGCSIVAKNSKQLQNAVQKMEANLEGFTRKAEEISQFSGKYQGLNRTVEIIETLLD